MCGILGVLNKNFNQPDENKIKNMLGHLKHRGPDADGIWINNCLALAHTRLKVIDLSDDANQPFTDGNDALIFNGEIFNFRELKKELNYKFITSSDTEVLFRALQTWDIHALNKIDGQFSFAFYRESNKTLLLARDKFGICPLYIYEDNKEFWFSSEIKPLLQLKKYSLNINGVIDYFAYRYNIQNGLTFFSDIKRFNPGSFLKKNIKTGEEELTKKYWTLKFNPLNRTSVEIQEQFENIFNKEVELQKFADVPVGLYLSGGIDSGALLRGFSKYSTQIESFTLNFSKDDEDLNRVIQLKERHHFEGNFINFTFNDFDSLEDVVFSLEEPFGDLIICANYLLAKNASKKVRVVLSGEGGDEMFCGYDHQRNYLKLLKLSNNNIINVLAQCILKIMPACILGLMNSYPGKFGNNEKVKIYNTFKKFKSPSDAYISLISLFNDQELVDLFSDKIKKNIIVQQDKNPIYDIFESEKKIYQAIIRSEIEQLTMIVNLLKQDRFTMRFSLEGRVPFVSRRIAEFISELPFENIVTKVNKEILINYSKNQIIKKKPFSLFANKYYLNALLKLMNIYVTKDAINKHEILSWERVETIKKYLPNGNLLIIKKAMAILIFMVWMKVFENNIK